MTPLLELTALQVHARARTLLDVPHFCLDRGELVSLVGPNGSGKTTFLHTVGLLRQPDSGQVIFAGQTVSDRNAAMLRRSISIVFQAPLLFSVDVLRNTSAGLRFHGVNPAEARRRALEALALFGVAHLAHRKPRGLSGGEAARVALARAFVTSPDLLLLDEPFSALDAGTRSALIPELRERLTDREAAAILVTHDLTEAFAFASRLTVLDGGRVIADGDARDLTMRSPTRRVAQLLGSDNVIAGRVVGQERGLFKVEFAPGRHILATADPPPRLRDLLDVTIPAPAIRLLHPGAAAPNGWNTAEATVAHVSAQPGWDMITIVMAGFPLHARVLWEPDGSRWAAGEMATAAFAPEAAWIIPEARAG